MEECCCEQRGDGTEHVSHETLAGDCGARGFAVAVGGVGVAGFEDEEDTWAC